MRAVRFPRPILRAFLAATPLLGLLLAGPTVRAAADLSAADSATDARYAVNATRPGDSTLQAPFETASPVSDLRVGFRDSGVRFASKLGEAWSVDVTLVAAGAAGDVEPARGVLLSAGGNRVDYSFSSTVTGSYENTSRGIAQTFRIAAPPAEGSLVALDLAVAGTLTPRLDKQMLHTVELASASRTVLRLAEVHATDADGNEVPVALELDGQVIRIVMERAALAYPVTVSGIFASPKTRRTPPAFDASAPEAPLAPMAPPSNDLCAGAVVIPPGGAFPHTTAVVNLSEATTVGDPAEPSCKFPGAAVTRSIWYTFTPSATGNYTFSTCGSGTTVDDTVMALYTSTGGCGGTLTEAPGMCDDDSCGANDFRSIVVAPLTQGTTYYLVLWNEGPAPQAGFTNVQLVVSASFAPNPPANDTCAGAAAIPAAGPFPYLTPTIADMSDASSAGDPAAPTCTPSGFSIGRSVWYSFTPAATGAYTISTCSEGGTTATTMDDTILAVYTSASACAGAFTEISTVGSSDGCDDDGCSATLQSSLNTSLIAGTQYFIVASGVGTGPLAPGHTALQLRVSLGAAPTNELCSGATGLVLDTPVAGTTIQAVDDYRSPFNATCYSGVANTNTSAIGKDVVYAFTPPITTTYSFRLSGFDATKNAALYVASDCPSAGTPPLTVTCIKGANRNSSSSSEEVNCVPLTAGTPVFVYVDENANTPGSTFTIEVNRCFPETEPNDTPATASTRQCGTEGAISPAGEADFFALGTQPAGTRIFAMADGAAGSTTDFDLRVTTDLDTVEFDDLNADPPFGALSPVIAGAPLTAAASYLRVNINPATGVASEPYRLYAAKQPPIASAVAEIEPNGTTAQATSSPSGYYTGTLSGAAPSTDVDLFSFTANTGDLIFIALDEDPTRDMTPVNAGLTLLDNNGTTLVAVNDGAFQSSVNSGLGGLNKISPFAPAEGLLWRARYAGTYYARVAIGTTSTGAEGAGNYLLSVVLNCQPADDPDGDGVSGAADCAPNDAGVSAIPNEIATATFSSNKTSMTWSPASGGPSATYDVVRGDRSALPVGPGGGDEICFPNLPTTTVTDATVPNLGSALWYLVRGKNSCGVGTWGRQGVQGVPGAVRTTTTCP